MIAVAYLLTGYTGGINSSFYFLLLLPVVSAANWFGVTGTIICTLASVGAYLSFLLPAFIDWEVYVLGPFERQELVLRVMFLAVIGYLTNMLAEATREQSAKHRAVAEQLAEANRSLREAEAAVRRSDRLAALGQLTAGLAHELRNPLGTIRASAEMLTKSLPEDSEMAREMAGFIRSEVDRTNSLVTRFLEFARPVPLRLAPADIAEVIGGIRVCIRGPDDQGQAAILDAAAILQLVRGNNTGPRLHQRALGVTGVFLNRDRSR